MEMLGMAFDTETWESGMNGGHKIAETQRGTRMGERNNKKENKWWIATELEGEQNEMSVYPRMKM